MFLIFKQYCPGDKEHGEQCSICIDSIVAMGTAVDVEHGDTKYTRILFENKETVDVQESVEAIVDLFSKIGR